MPKDVQSKEKPAVGTASVPLLGHQQQLSKPQTQRSSAKLSKLSSKQTKNKKANPNSNVPFNHRAQFTKFKRRIHAQRRWVMEKSHKSEADIVTSVQSDNENNCSITISSSGSTRDAEGYEEVNQVSPNAADAGVRLRAPESDQLVTQAMKVMDALYLQLDAAMKQRRFGRAAFLKRCLRARQQQLRRELQSKQFNTSTAGAATVEKSVSVKPCCSPTKVKAVVDATSPCAPSASVYHSFHPSSTWLGVGRHSLSDWVDQRSGRYPKLSTSEQISYILHNFIDDQLSKCVNDAPAEWIYLIPVTPSPVQAEGSEKSNLKDAEQTRPPRPSIGPLTRAQRQQKASLYVGSYSTNLLTDTLDDLCFTLLQGLYKEQRDLKQKQPLQFKARQRYVVGFQEVLKCLKAGRVKLVLLAADVESVDVSEAELQAVIPADQNTEHTAASPSAGTAPPTTTMTSKPKTKSTRKKAFQSLHEAITQVQQLCGVLPTVQTPALDSGCNNTSEGAASSSQRMPPLCVTCMSRQRLSYALFAKGSKVACVGVMQAEKNRDALKAVTAYGRLLTQMYSAEVGSSATLAQ